MSYNSILRKKTSPIPDFGDVRQVDLLVFGYACKVFRDDAKALEIDQGKHLIDWMGDSSLKIDRYDVRGALYDLAPHEVPPGGYGNRLDYISADEQRAEQLCEQERYFFLYNNEEEHILQQEEDLKRLAAESNDGCYNQVGFQYGNEHSGVQQGPQREGHTNSPSNEEKEQPFNPPKNFDVPAKIQPPETMKQHAIIEKTARFIATQGVQMEILLKAKQSNNVQFEFLTQNSVLNPYYKFIVEAIKNGTYPAEEVAPESSEVALVTETAEYDLDKANVATKPIITVPTIKYKPSANCAYTQLISKIKGLPLPQVIQEGDNASATGSPTIANSNSDQFTPVLLQYNGNTFITADDEGSNSNSNQNSQTYIRASDKEPKVEILNNSSAFALAQDYASDSEEDYAEPAKSPKSPSVLNFPIPPETLQNIIDKTALYVIKNGRQFEETLRTKDEDRFTFLVPDNEFYPYYMYKITGDPESASKEQKTRKAAAVAAALLSKKGLKTENTISPVSFCIKPKDDLSSSALTPALPQEESDDEEDKSKTASSRAVPESVQKAIQLVESQLMAKNAQLVALTGGATNQSRSSVPTIRSRFDLDYVSPPNAKTHVKSSKAELERNALFEQQQQNRQKELRKAEEKVKDKLAQIAREKLCGLLSKEKQLQLERRKKAMAFLNQIKDTSVTPQPKGSSPGEEKQSKPGEVDGNVSDDSEASVHSIPITSYGPEGKTDDEDETAPYILHIPIQIAQETPTIVSPKQTKKLKPTTVLLSDDDDVQVISESKPIKRGKQKSRSTHKRRTRTRSRSLSRSRSRLRMRSRSLSRSRSRTRSVSSQRKRLRKYEPRDDSHNRYRSSKKKSKKSASRRCRSKNSRSVSIESVDSDSRYRREKRSSRTLIHSHGSKKKLRRDR